MSAAIAMAPSPAPHDRERSSFPSSDLASPTAQRTASAPGSVPTLSTIHSNSSHRPGSRSPKGGRPAPGPIQSSPATKSSPPSASRNAVTPKIVVKKEPGSPEHAPRRRPGRLDLSKGGATAGPGTGRPLTARDGLGIQEVGLACLSPGFVTQDPVMKEQLQRSMSVREQQRHIIEARLQQQSAKGDGPGGSALDQASKDKDSGFAAKTPGISSRRNKAPPGLSIVAPSHEQFAHERVIQSAPLGQTFTGMHNPHPLTRHITNQPSKLASTSHIHLLPAHQTANRLPPISDVFGQGLSGHPESTGHAGFAQQSNAARGPAPPPSPGHPHHHQQQIPQPPHTSRPREYKSAEEAQHELAGGRPELLPKLVRYGGGHQPPTPPSPQPGHPRTAGAIDPRSASRRRTRAEYEDGASPPLGNGPGAQRQRRGPFGEGRDSPEAQRAKREEFLRLCERAWDLFHS